jgi:hypothetical protein
MPRYFYQWTPAIERHLADNFVTPEEFMEVVERNRQKMVSDSTGELATKGYTSEGRFLFCVWRMIDDISVEPVTAFEPSQR